MGFGAAAGAQMEAGQERREPGLALDWLFGLPGVGQQKRAEERRQTVGLCHPGVPAGEFLCLVPGLVIDERVFGRRGWGGGLAGLAARRKRGFGGRRRFGFFGRGERGRAGLAKIRGRTLGAGTLPCPLPCPLPSPSDSFLGTLLGDTVGAAETAAAPDQPQNPSGRQQGFRIAGCRHAAQAQIGVRPDEVMGGAADVHPGLMENEVLERHEGALGPEGGAGLGGIGPGEDAGADRAFPQPLVEPGERVVGGRQRPDEVGERGGAKREGAGRWDRGGPGGPGFGGHRGSRCGTGKLYRINNNRSLTQVNKLCHCLTRTPRFRGYPHR